MSSHPQFHIVPITLIAKSPTNPRKSFPSEYISELASSISLKGIISPLLVRSTDELPEPVARKYELIAGECRLRAAEQAGLSEVPVLVRDDLSSNDVLELQLIENLQRRELDVLEEAESYAALLELEDAGVKRHSMESLASAISKSIHYIRERLNLMHLPEAAKESLRSGELSFSVARLIAVIPSVSLREKALNEVLHPTYEEEPLTARKAASWIREHFMIKMNKVPFDRASADLVPVEHDPMGQRVKGGACADCPWLSGNLRTLSEDHPSGGNPDLCMHPGCYSEKLEASWQETCAEALKAGKRVLSDKESEAEISPYESGLAWNSKYILLADKVAAQELAESSEKPPTWKKLLANVSVKPEIVVLRDRNHRPLECVLKREALAAIKLEAEKSGEPSPLKGRSQQGSEEKSQKEQSRAEEKLESKIAKQTLHAGIRALVDLFASEKAPHDAVLWPRVFDAVLSLADGSLIQEYLGVSDPEDFDDERAVRDALMGYPVGKAREALAPYVLLLPILARYGPQSELREGNVPNDFCKLLESFGIDMSSISETVQEAHAGEAKELKKAAKLSRKKQAEKEEEEAVAV